MNNKLTIKNIERLMGQWINPEVKIFRVDKSPTIYWLHTTHELHCLLALYRYPVDASNGELWELKAHGVPFPNRVLFSKKGLQSHNSFITHIQKLFQ